MTARSYRTAKGTDLPLLNLRGKQYLEVKYRLVWFREEHPDWSIETELLSVTDVSAYARAILRDEKGRIITTSHKFESVQGFPDFIEKAETGAIGRALALIGYGTQFCADELDEGTRGVDAHSGARMQRSAAAASRPELVKRTPTAAVAAPVKAVSPQQKMAVTGAPVSEAAETPHTQEQNFAPQETSVQKQSSGETGDYVITFGRKYKGKKLSEVPKNEIEGYIQWLENSAVSAGSSVSHQVEVLKTAFERFYQGETAAAF